MNARVTLPFRRVGALFAVLALTLGLTAAATLTSPPAHAARCNNVYDGGWTADDPKGHLNTVVFYFPDCSRLNTGKIFVVSKPFLGLGSGVSSWGAADATRWGIYGTSVTATWVYDGLTESLYIRPAGSGRLLVTETEYFANGSKHTMPAQYFHRG